MLLQQDAAVAIIIFHFLVARKGVVTQIMRMSARQQRLRQTTAAAAALWFSEDGGAEKLRPHGLAGDRRISLPPAADDLYMKLNECSPHPENREARSAHQEPVFVIHSLYSGDTAVRLRAKHQTSVLPYQHAQEESFVGLKSTETRACQARAALVPPQTVVPIARHGKQSAFVVSASFSLMGP